MIRALRRLPAASSAARALVRSAAHPGYGIDTPPTWPVSPELQARLSIRWPTRYEWPLAGNWVDGLRRGLSAHVRVRSAELDQPYPGTVLIQVGIDHVWYDVAIDYFDKDRLLEEVAGRCALVFKMQYRRDGYGLSHVVPGGYVPGRPYLERFIPGLRHLRENYPPRFEVYGRFGPGHAVGLRSAAVSALQQQRRFAYEGDMRLLPYGDFLREAALSRVCVDLPGNGDLCHRLVDYLAVGCCVVRPEPTVSLHVPLQNGLDIAFAEDAELGLVAACERLLAQPAENARMADRARRYFDAYLTIDQLAGYYLDRCRVMLGVESGVAGRQERQDQRRPTDCSP